MKEETSRVEPRGDDSDREQFENLLIAWISRSLSAERQPDIVEEVIRERRDAIALDAEALADRLRAEVDVEVRHRERALQEISREPMEKGREFIRFSLNMRLQHILLFCSCIVLILTGLPIKFYDTAWAAFMFDLMGGIQNSALLHRIGAAGLIGVSLYHLFYLTFLSEGRLNFLRLIPSPKDLRDLLQMLNFFLGRSNEKPKFGRFSYVEKFDYWAVYWGCVIMIGSGALLWFENITLNLFPKYVLDIAKEAHSDEALLATLAIIIWHFYNVHFNPHKFPMNKVWLTGKLTEEEMIEEHPLEYEEIMREEGQQKRRSTP